MKGAFLYEHLRESRHFFRFYLLLQTEYECARFCTLFTLQYFIPVYISNKINELKIVGIMALIMLEKINYCVQSSTDRIDIILASITNNRKKVSAYFTGLPMGLGPGFPAFFWEKFLLIVSEVDSLGELPLQKMITPIWLAFVLITDSHFWQKWNHLSSIVTWRVTKIESAGRSRFDNCL